MTNTEISNNNPEKELIKDNSISVDKTKQISKKNTTQNKKITPKKDNSNKGLFNYFASNRFNSTSTRCWFSNRIYISFIGVI